MAGLFFCLASAEGAGLLFCPAEIQPRASVYSAFCSVNANYTAHAAKRFTGLYMGASGYLPHFTAVYARPTHAAIIPPATRWSVSQRRSTSSTYQIPTPRRTLYRSAQPPIIIMYIMGAADRRPCKPGGVSMIPTPGISLALCFLPSTTARNY